MEDKDIVFTIKADTKPIQDSMGDVVEDIASGKTSLTQFAKQLQKLSSIKIDGITDKLNEGLILTKELIKGAEKELGKLGVSDDIILAKNEAENLSKAVDTSKMASGMKNISGVIDKYVSDIQYGIGSLDLFKTSLANANKFQIKDMTIKLRSGLKQSELEISNLQKQLLVAFSSNVSPTKISEINEKLKIAVANGHELRQALALIDKQNSQNVKGFARIPVMFKNIGNQLKISAKYIRRMAFSSLLFSGLGILRRGLSEAIELSDNAKAGFTGMGNAIAGTLIPVVNSLANAIRRAFVWISGLINFVSGGRINLIQKGIDATSKKMKKLGETAKGTGKAIANAEKGSLSGLDEINNIDTNSGGAGGAGGAELQNNANALTELQSMLTEMNNLNFEWATPLKNVLSFIQENGALIATIVGLITAGWLAYNMAVGLATIVSIPLYAIIFAIVTIIGGLIALIMGVIELFKEGGNATKAWTLILGGLLAIIVSIGIAFGLVPMAIALAVGAVVAGILWVIKNFELVKTTILNVFKTVKDWFIRTFNTIVEWFKSNWQSILLFIINPFAGVFKYLYDNFEGFRNFINNTVTSIGNFFKNLWSTICNGASSAFNWIKNIFKNIAHTVGSMISGVVRNAVYAVLSRATKIINGFISAINFAINAINLIPGVNIRKLSKLSVPSFDVGTDYVPEDMLAVVHKGERITPKKYNDENWNKEVDMSETNGLLENLISVVMDKNLVIGEEAVGKASVNYILAESRRRGENII